jgi:two-component system, NarL family, sensor histidine kinase LiaS
MNLMVKRIVFILGITLLVMLASLGFVFIAFPLEEWSDLFTQTILDIPFYVLPLVFTVAIGIIAGMILGLQEMNKMKVIDQALSDITLDNKQIEQEIPTNDLEDIFSKLTEIQNQLKEKTLVTQKLVNEKVKIEEKHIQEVISEERNRLARELHDSVSQQLFAASMLMSAITEGRPVEDTPETKQLQLVEQMIQQSQLEMRALLLHLRPVALNGKSLKTGIEELLMELKMKVPLEIEWKVEDIQLERGVEDHLFRILQESVSNTLRHSKANKMEVLLIARDQFFIMRVADDGVGFNPETSKSGSYGLQNMKERAVEIGGTFKIVSLPGKGTRLDVKLPNYEVKQDNVGREDV